MEVATCKLALILYLGILSVMLTSEQKYTSMTACSWMLSQSDLFLTSLPDVSLREVDELGLESAAEVEEKFKKRTEKGYF